MSTQIDATRSRRPPPWVAYGLATLAVMFAAALRELMFHVPHLQALGEHHPLSFLYPAVMFAVLYGGMGPGIWAVVLAFLLAAFRLGWSGAVTHIPTEADIPRLTLFLVVNGMILLIGNRAHRARRDVGSRFAAQEALRESEDRYRRLVETAQEAICQINAIGLITYANPALGRLLNVPVESILGKRLTDFVEGELATPLERLRSTGSAELIEMHLHRADGTSIIAQVSTSRLLNDDGTYAGELAVITDVTERRTIETERQELLRREQRARADAEAANRRKDQFLAVLSHELRTPLTPVLARLSLLKREPGLSAVAKNGLEMIRRNVELEARLIDDLLDVTRLARGQLKLHLETVDAHEILRNALAIYEEDIARKRQQLDLHLDADEHFVRADSVRLQQVFWNLISNAVKYTPEGGIIAVRTEDDSGESRNGSGRSQPHLRVMVKDSGIGIDPNVMPRIFDPFEQGEQTLTRRYGGLGLGLSISRSLMQMHGGSLTAESHGAGEGATFIVEIPTVAGAVRAAPRPKPTEGPAAEPQRILLVDDNEDTLRVMARLLRLSGHKVVTADSLNAAVSAADQPFDLLITDIGLPDGTGWELMNQLRQRGPVRGIAISGFSMDEDVRRSEAAGFVEHLSKPINPDDLDRAIRRAVVEEVA